MDVHDEYVPDEQFRRMLEQFPQVCVEVVVTTDDGVLVCRRRVKPRVWFWPGGRLYKGEGIEEAVHRVAREELGIEVGSLERLGVEEHFWDADETAEGVSRHTVNLVYRASPRHEDFSITLDDQHTAYRFLTEVEPDLHPYIRRYLERYPLLD